MVCLQAASLNTANQPLHALVLHAFILILIDTLTKSVICFDAQGGQYPLHISKLDSSFYAAEGLCVIIIECAMSDLECVNGVGTDRRMPCPVRAFRSTIMRYNRPLMGRICNRDVLSAEHVGGAGSRVW